jgi:uncharacterized protein
VAIEQQMTPLSDTALAALFKATNTIALVGASPKKERDSYRVMRFLLDKGFKVIPVNPGLEGQEILGQKVYWSLAAIEGPVDLVDIFRNSEAAGTVVDEAIAIGAQAIWMQLGVINEAAAKRAHAAGLSVVMDRCPKIEMPRLGL